MKSTKGSIGRAVDQPDPNVRVYLFHGADEAQSAALGERLLTALNAGKQALAVAAVRSDPAALVDEAGAISLFGERRAIWIEPATDDIGDAVDLVLAAPACENPVIAIAGSLKKSSGLLKSAEAHPLALAHVSYVPEGADAERLVTDLARQEGLRPASGVAVRLAASCGNDSRSIRHELAKYALYLDASPETPRELTHDALDQLGAEAAGDFLGIADLAMAGKMRELMDELAQISGSGNEAVPVLRSLQRRLIMLAPLRARVERGERPDAVLTSLGKSLFWKDKPAVARMLSSWDAAGIARLGERIGTLERQLMRSDAPPSAEALGEELITIARTAARRR